MRKAFESYVFVLKVLVALLLASMVVLVFGNVVLRYAFNLGITVSEELSRIFFVWLTFLGATVAVWERGHIGVDSLLRVVPEKVARLLLILAYALMLVAIALLIQGAWAQTVINMRAAMPVTRLPVGILYLAAIVFAVPSGLMILRELFRLVAGRSDLATEGSIGAAEGLGELNVLPGGSVETPAGRRPGGEADQ